MTDCDWKLDCRRAEVSLSGMQGWFSKTHCLTSAKLPPKWCRPHTVKTPCSSAQRPARTRTNNLMEEDNALSFSASLHSHLYRISLCASPSPLLPFMIWSELCQAELAWIKKAKKCPKEWAETPKRRKQTGGSSRTADPKPHNLNYTYYKWGGAKLDGEEEKLIRTRGNKRESWYQGLEVTGCGTVAIFMRNTE